jgi:hypothetical protein
MSYVYKIEVNGAYRAYIKADTATEARRTALAHVTVERLGAGEIIDLMQRGVAIVSAETGKVCNGSDNDQGGQDEA